MACWRRSKSSAASLLVRPEDSRLAVDVRKRAFERLGLGVFDLAVKTVLERAFVRRRPRHEGAQVQLFVGKRRQRVAQRAGTVGQRYRHAGTPLTARAGGAAADQEKPREIVGIVLHAFSQDRGTVAPRRRARA